MKIALHPKKFVRFFFVLILLSISFYSFTNGGGAPAANTAAPGDGNCTGCHGGSLITTGANWNNVSITSNIPAAGYTPGSSYTVTVSHSQVGINKFGFQFTALSATASMAGSLSAGTGSQAITSGGRTYLTHTGGGTSGIDSKSWSFTWVAPDPGIGAVSFYTTINAANGDNSTFGDQIYAKSVSVPQFSNLPTAVISGLPSNSIVCLGDTLNLQGSGLNSPGTFNWTIAGTASSQQNPQVIFTTTGQKTITLITSNSFGSSSTNTKFVSVINRPVATISPAGTASICGDDSVTLSANFNSLFAYLWTPGDQTTSSIKTADPGVYKVKITNLSTGCATTSAGVTLTDRPKPVPVLTLSKDTICSADSLELSSTAPYINYAFFDISTALQSGPVGSYKNLFASGSRSIGLVVTDSNGCNSDTIRESVRILPKLPAPVISCGAKTSSSVEFTWLAIPGASGYEVSLDNGQSWIAPNGTLAHTINGLSPNSNAQVWVRALDPSLCAKGDDATQICTNGACSPVSYTIDFDNEACVDDAQDTGYIIVTLSNLSASIFSIQYGTGLYTASTTYLAPVMLGTNTLQINIKDSGNVGCPVTDTTITLTGINPITTTPILVTGGSLCSGDSAVHIIKIQNANSGADQFELYRNSGASPLTILNADGSNELTYSVSKTLSPFQTGDELMVIALEMDHGCAKISDILEVTIETTPKVGFTISTSELSATFEDTTSRISNRDWKYFGAFTDEMNGTKSVTKTYAAGGTYQVMLVGTDSNGCSNSATQSFVLFNVGLNDIAGLNKTLNMYPNPVTDVLEIKLESKEPVQIIIYDMQGKLVREEAVNTTGKIELGDLTKGLYSIYVKQGEALYSGKFIKE